MWSGRCLIQWPHPVSGLFGIGGLIWIAGPRTGGTGRTGRARSISQVLFAAVFAAAVVPTLAHPTRVDAPRRSRETGDGTGTTVCSDNEFRCRSGLSKFNNPCIPASYGTVLISAGRACVSRAAFFLRGILAVMRCSDASRTKHVSTRAAMVPTSQKPQVWCSLSFSPFLYRVCVCVRGARALLSWCVVGWSVCAECNDHDDCLDGSDEASDHCGKAPGQMHAMTV